MNNQNYLVIALTLSPNMAFMQVYYKNLGKNDLHKIYVNKVGGCVELTDEEVDNVNRTAVTLGRQLGTGYIISKDEEQLRNILST